LWRVFDFIGDRETVKGVAGGDGTKVPYGGASSSFSSSAQLRPCLAPWNRRTPGIVEQFPSGAERAKAAGSTASSCIRSPHFSKLSMADSNPLEAFS
jgi:hypothetical protein